MSWVIAAFIVVPLVSNVGGELESSHAPRQRYHPHAHYSYEPIIGGNYYNTTAIVGETAVLRCRFKEPDGRKILWVRSSDWHILSSNLDLFINDPRFSVTHPAGSDQWNMRIKPAQTSDTGSYECQVNDGETLLSTIIHLHVKRPRAILSGARQYHMVPGSSLTLHCDVVETRYPVRRVEWWRDDVQLFSSKPESTTDEPSSTTSGPEPTSDERDSAGGRLTIVTRLGVTNTSSELVLSNVDASQSGVYSCQSPAAEPDSVKLFVNNAADKTAAISGRNSSPPAGGGGSGGGALLSWLVPIFCLLVR